MYPRYQQRVYRTPIGKAPAVPPTGPINAPLPPGQRQKVLQRVGFNPGQKGRIDPTTGERFLTGQFPTLGGIDQMLKRVKTRSPYERIQVRVYGQPNWEQWRNKNYMPDDVGNVFITYVTTRDVLEQELAGANSVEDLVFVTGGFNFERVLTVLAGTL